MIISDYQPTWPQDFAAIRTALLEVLGPGALRIDHIGSTAVPGLGAKDVIDVQITVAALTAEVRQQLIDAGYRHFPHITGDHVPLGADDDPARWAKFFFNERPGTRRANIHIRVAGSHNQQYPLLFRDYLRAHPNSARSIELIKRRLARLHPDDMDAYYDIKDPVYDLIWDAALQWAQWTRWQPE
jgi:GrpB-like predicted nucleotidyltransferase (UPF0157 family)